MSLAQCFQFSCSCGESDLADVSTEVFSPYLLVVPSPAALPWKPHHVLEEIHVASNLMGEERVEKGVGLVLIGFVLIALYQLYTNFTKWSNWMGSHRLGRERTENVVFFIELVIFSLRLPDIFAAI